MMHLDGKYSEMNDLKLGLSTGFHHQSIKQSILGKNN
jgi:hypothetical protein